MISPADESPEIEQLLGFLRDERGFDFTGYKRPSLLRRIARRMTALGIDSIEDYHEFLEVHPEEFPVLFDTILINVTEFFRDPEAWELLAEQVLPLILAQGPAERPLRFWSAGCATGEEAYTLAMVLAEVLGEEAFRSRVKIYATDVDEEALTVARQGSFPVKALDSVDAALRSRYFEIDEADAVFRRDLRRSIIFGRHDLTSDAPISRLDLLCCRNTLMYFNAELQARVVSRFHYALDDSGFLFLGKAETLLTHHTLFTPVDTRFRIFSKIPTGTPRFPDLLDDVFTSRTGRLSELPILSRAAVVSPAAQLVVDLDGVLIGANSVARAQFGLSPADIGRPFHDLPVSYRHLELSTLVEAAFADSAPHTRPGVERRLGDGSKRYVDVTATPLLDDVGQPLGASIVFIDVTETIEARHELARAREEIQAIRSELESTNEELETSNEELQSTNEELETSNEELQSSNEELETTNEELHSANEELSTMNEELQRRTLDLDRSNGLLDSVVGSLLAGVVVVNWRLEVEVWNRAVQDMFGLTADDAVGRPFTSLDVQLPVDELAGPLREAIAGTRCQLAVPTVDRQGRAIVCRIGMAPLVVDQRELRGAVLVLTTEPVS